MAPGPEDDERAGRCHRQQAGVAAAAQRPSPAPPQTSLAPPDSCLGGTAAPAWRSGAVQSGTLGSEREWQCVRMQAAAIRSPLPSAPAPQPHASIPTYGRRPSAPPRSQATVIHPHSQPRAHPVAARGGPPPTCGRRPSAPPRSRCRPAAALCPAPAADEGEEERVGSVLGCRTPGTSCAGRALGRCGAVASTRPSCLAGLAGTPATARDGPAQRSAAHHSPAHLAGVALAHRQRLASQLGAPRVQQALSVGGGGGSEPR